MTVRANICAELSADERLSGLRLKCEQATSKDLLEERLQTLEKGAQFDASQSAIRQREQEFLTTLRGIKAAMLKEEGGAASSAEVQDLKTENQRLKELAAKQEYRIKHLIAGFEKVLTEKAS